MAEDPREYQEQAQEEATEREVTAAEGDLVGRQGLAGEEEIVQAEEDLKDRASDASEEDVLEAEGDLE